VCDSTKGLAIDKGTRLEEEERNEVNYSDCEVGIQRGGRHEDYTTHTEMLRPAFRTRT
jgi:hypothetical protein